MNGKTRRIRTLTLVGALAALALALGAASPARAGNFGAGFEDELGRIAAHAAVGAGVHLLHHAVAPPYVETRVVHRTHRSYGPRPHYRKHHRGPHWKHGHRGHGYGRGHRHGGHWRGIPPCEVDHRVTVERRTRYSRW